MILLFYCFYKNLNFLSGILASNTGGYVRMRISLMSSFALSEFNLQLNSDNKSNSETNKKPSTMIEEDSLALRMVPLVQQQGLIDYSSKLSLEFIQDVQYCLNELLETQKLYEFYYSNFKLNKFWNYNLQFLWHLQFEKAK